MSKTGLLIAALAAAGLFSPAPAWAGSDPAAEAVRYADLDLDRPADVRRLERRIGVAAARVCGAASDSDPLGRRTVERCRRDAIARAAEARDRAVAAHVRSAPAMASRER